LSPVNSAWRSKPAYANINPLWRSPAEHSNVTSL
jgi:hypothetical protein